MAGRFVRTDPTELSGGNACAQARRHELEGVLGLVEVAQPVLAKVQQLGTRGQPVADEDGRHARQQHLAAVSDREQPRDPVERRTEEVAVARVGGTRVERHPDTDGSDGMLAKIRETDLARERRDQARRRLVEAREEAVAGRLDDRRLREPRPPPAGSRRGRRGGRASRPDAPPRGACSPRCRSSGRSRWPSPARQCRDGGWDACLVGHGRDHCTLEAAPSTGRRGCLVARRPGGRPTGAPRVGARPGTGGRGAGRRRS